MLLVIAPPIVFTLFGRFFYNKELRDPAALVCLCCVISTLIFFSYRREIEISLLFWKKPCLNPIKEEETPKNEERRREDDRIPEFFQFACIRPNELGDQASGFGTPAHCLCAGNAVQAAYLPLRITLKRAEKTKSSNGPMTHRAFLL